MKLFVKIMRIAVAVLSAGFFLWFSLPIVKHIICLGNIAGILISAFVFCRVVFTGFFARMKEKAFAKKITKVLWRICQGGIAVFVCYALIISGIMVYASYRVPQEGSTVITLGAMVRPDGTPSGSLWYRINACYDYLTENENSVAVLSGGKGDNEPMSEAQCMYDYLVDMGIDKDRLIIEDKSENTEANMKNSYKIIDENNLNKNVAIATDSYHQLRAKIIARRIGVTESVGAVNSDSPLSVFPTYWVREWFAIPVELIK
ncbi:MAG: YdcF family protein [Ruminococcus sp.]